MFFFPSTPKGYSVGGLELKLAISCSVLDELPPNRKAVSEQRRHSCSETPHSLNNTALCRCTFRYINAYLLLGIRHGKAPPPPLHFKCTKLVLGGLAKLQKLATSSVTSAGPQFLLSVRPNGTTRLPPDGGSLNLTRRQIRIFYHNLFSSSWNEECFTQNIQRK